MRRAFVVVGTGLIAVACTSSNEVAPAADAAIPAIDAGTHDATLADGSVDSGADTTVEDAPEDVAHDAPIPADASDAADAADAADSADAADAPDLFDAATFPDAANLAGLHITFFGNGGAYPETSLDAFLASNATVARIQTSATDAALAAGDLAGVDVVILDQLPRDFTADEAQTLATWVAAGGGLFSMSGYTGGSSDVTRPDSLLAPYGIQYGTFFGSSINVAAITPHPTMTHVDFIHFYGGFSVVADADAGTTTIIGMLDATNAGLVARSYGSGRVVVWGDEWIEYDSEFSTNPSNQRFWDNTIAWLAGR